jgi:hypothetical protein
MEACQHRTESSVTSFKLLIKMESLQHKLYTESLRLIKVMTDDRSHLSGIEVD